MASRLGIINLALQNVGAARVGAVEDSELSVEANQSYDTIRDVELRANAWGFASKRVNVAAHSVAPAFDFLKAYPLPVDCLRVLFPVRQNLDWRIENHEGAVSILTNQDSSPLRLRYISRASEALFDPLFTLMLGCALGWQIAERVTQSNSKRDAMRQRYTDIRREARRLNAFERVPDKSPVDEWLTGLQTGQFAGVDWGEQ
ncbi:MAG: hypothetical protein IPK83_20425 [Planctomycetes bacterium]|nr:hypothetical protein [Planctomycetota bacterium]